MLILSEISTDLPLEILEALPSPVFLKGPDARYVWANSAFKNLFGIKRHDLFGKLDRDLFPSRQVSQCNGGDLRVLETGKMDEAREVIVDRLGISRATITLKSRLQLPDGTCYITGVMHDISDVSEANRKLRTTGSQLERRAAEWRDMSHRDVLTNCYNRRYLFENKNLVHAQRAVGIAIADLDHFKLVNDTLGHDAGDKVLCGFVETVETHLREGDFIARLGGEEFAIVMPDITADDFQTILERIRSDWQSVGLKIVEGAMPITVSIGAVLREQGEKTDFYQCVDLADKCLYEAKHAGRNRVVFGPSPEA